MSSKDNVETQSLVTPSDRLVGRVKWFNNKAGYGFITVTNNEQSENDIFVHHSGLLVCSEQYKYLIQGEYVSFRLNHSPGENHEYHAKEVSGINDGKLMCETRRDFRQTRMTYKSSDESKFDENNVEVMPPRSSRPPRIENSYDSQFNRGNNSIPRARGEGPREGSEWTMVSQQTNNRVSRGPTNAGGRGRGRSNRIYDNSV